MPIHRCPNCGSVLPTTTIPRAIENRIEAGPATMEQIKVTARSINPKATDRMIYNALGMLTRYGRIRRSGYGIYEAVSHQNPRSRKRLSQ